MPNDLPTPKTTTKIKNLVPSVFNALGNSIYCLFHALHNTHPPNHNENISHTLEIKNNQTTPNTKHS
jgi:hypothetical protein